MSEFIIHIGTTCTETNNQIDLITAGESMTDGTLCYLDVDGKYWEADASAKVSSVTELRIVREAVTANDTTEALVTGYKKYEAGPSFYPLTVGARYYISTTPGEITTTLYEDTNNICRYVGTAQSQECLYFNPDHVFVSDDGTQVMDVIIKTGADKHYAHVQAISTNLWSITHGMEKYPSVQVIDDSGNNVCGVISYTDANTLTLTFYTPFTGTAYLN